MVADKSGAASVKLIDCDARRHSAPILAIFNEAIANSTALYDYKPRAAESMVGWFEAKARGRYPVIGIEDDAGTLMGFGSMARFAPGPRTNTPSSIPSTSTPASAVAAWAAGCSKPSSTPP